MIKKILILSFIFTLLLAACAPAATPTEAPAQPTEAPAQPTEAPPEPTEPAMPSGEVVVATPGQALNMVFLPKNLGNAVFDEAHEGALEAAQELGNPDELQYLAPASGAA
ncbi:MAG: substrate-binding domain-containing protein, partial [Anaerolineales bacterium]